MNGASLRRSDSKASTASGLEQYAERVRKDWRSQTATSVESLSFPMYVVSLKLLMTMTVVECHEELLRKGQLQRYRPGMGRTMFVSHQWAGRDHPDPEFAQFRVLQSALQHLADGSVKPSTTIGVEIRCGRVQCPSMENLDFERTFVWYDYFSCPQKEDREAHLQCAIDMIPNYIGFCDDFLVLCPPLIHEDESVMNQYSWSCRGWCRMEQILRELSTANSQVVVIVGDRQIMVSTFADSMRLSTSEGHFTIEEDRPKVAGVITTLIRRKLDFFLQKGDLPAYRLLLNEQGRLLKDLPIGEEIQELLPKIPGFVADLSWDETELLVQKFLYQNGFSNVVEHDSKGWSPMCYACLQDYPDLVSSLLQRGADPNDSIRKQQPLGSVFKRGMTVMHLSIVMQSNRTLSRLIASGADLLARSSFGMMSVHWAAFSNNAEACEILRAAGASFRALEGMRLSPVDVAAYFGSVEALEQILSFPKEERPALDFTLHFAVALPGNSPRLVPMLLSAGAGIDGPWRVKTCAFQGISCYLQTKHLFSPSRLTFWMWHCSGATPLMHAIVAGSFEQAAVLIAYGASLEAKNYRGCTAFDLASKVSAPEFLLDALEGGGVHDQRCKSFANASTESSLSRSRSGMSRSMTWTTWTETENDLEEPHDLDDEDDTWCVDEPPEVDVNDLWFV